VSSQDFQLVKLEGHPAANISFWAGKPYIVQHFQKVGPLWVTSENYSRAESAILGKTELHIKSYNHHIVRRQAPAEIALAH
jgi:hypothetical protein